MAVEEVPGTVPPSINCHQCNTLIDLTGQSAFTHVDCPQCGALSVVPLQFGNFLLLNPLGVGGMGTVYKAIDLALNRYLALKILRRKLAAKPEFIDSFSREARAAAAVNHPNIAQVYSFGEHDGQYYLAMELLERGSLDDRIATLGKIAEKDVLEIGQQVTAGLRAAATRDLLHRDIKPGNILFNDENLPKIVDFGLARASNESRAANEPIWGTPYYIAPEKLRGQSEDLRSDIYSLGATLFHALAGRPPFDAATASEVVTKHATQPALSLKTYAPDLQDFSAHVIGRMLSKNPAERYQTYDDLLHDFTEALANYKIAQSQKTVVAATGERIPLTSVVAAAVGLLLCVAAVMLVWRRPEFFGLAPWSTVSGNGTGAAATNATAGHPVGADDRVVDFKADVPWVKAWDTAMLALAAGNYQEAFQAFDAARTLAGRDSTRIRQWIQLYEGLTLLAADRPGMALSSFVKGFDTRAPREIPAQVTTANFVDPLILTMVGELPLERLEDARARLPAWAAALTDVCAGFKQLEAGQPGPAAAAFRRYVGAPRAERESWAFSLQPLADKLIPACDDAAVTLQEVDRLVAAGKFDDAQALLQQALTETHPALIKAAFTKRLNALQPEMARLAAEQARLQAEEERRRLETETRDRERATEEANFVQAIDPLAAPFLQRYDFRGAHQKYDQVRDRVTTDQGRQVLQARLDATDVLAEFKTRLAADFARRAYPGAELRTRANTTLMGDLSKATEDELHFTTQYGEFVHAWTDFAPSELAKLGVHYAAAFSATEDATTQARRWLALAVFAKQYGLEKAVDAYSQKAVRLQPEIQAELNRLLGR